MRLFFSLSSLSSSLSSSSSLSFPSRPLLLHFSQFSTSSSWRPDEDSRNVKVSVWWDFENCSIPLGTNVFKVSHLITSAVRANGIKGPLQIYAFGDVFQLSRANQEALSSTGISLNHVPHGYFSFSLFQFTISSMSTVFNIGYWCWLFFFFRKRKQLSLNKYTMVTCIVVK